MQHHEERLEPASIPWNELKINIQDQINALEKSIKIWSFIAEKTEEIIDFCTKENITDNYALIHVLNTQRMSIPSLVQKGVTCTDFNYRMILSGSIKNILIDHMLGETRIAHDCHCCEYGNSLGLRNSSNKYGICHVCPAKGFWDPSDLCIYFACEKGNSPYAKWSNALESNALNFTIYWVRVRLTAAKRVVQVLDNALNSLNHKKTLLSDK